MEISDIISQLKKDSGLNEQQLIFWDTFEKHQYKFPKLCEQIIDITKCYDKKVFLNQLSIYLEIFGKCIELNVKIANHFEESSSIDQLLVLNLIFLLLTKINSICLDYDNSSKILNLLKEITNNINLVDMEESQCVKKIWSEMTQILCKFFFI